MGATTFVGFLRRQLNRRIRADRPGQPAGDAVDKRPQRRETAQQSRRLKAREAESRTDAGDPRSRPLCGPPPILFCAAKHAEGREISTFTTPGFQEALCAIARGQPLYAYDNMTCIQTDHLNASKQKSARDNI